MVVDYKNHLVGFSKNLIDIYEDDIKKIKVDNFEDFFKYFEKILKDNQITFKYQKSNAKKGGSANIKIDKITFEHQKILYIERNENDYVKMNYFIHELAHLLLDHNELEKKIAKLKNISFEEKKRDSFGTFNLNKGQKEFVADLVGEIIVLIFTGKSLSDYSSLSIKREKKVLDDYRFNYLNDVKVNLNQYARCKQQIFSFINFILK